MYDKNLKEENCFIVRNLILPFSVVNVLVFMCTDVVVYWSFLNWIELSNSEKYLLFIEDLKRNGFIAVLQLGRGIHGLF